MRNKSFNRKIILFTSYPLRLEIGSGMVRMMQGIHAGFLKLGLRIELQAPDFEIREPRALALARLRFNREFARHKPSQRVMIIGSDFDGFALDVSSSYIHKVVINGGLLRDIVRFESGDTARLLRYLGHREEQNMRTANLIFVPSRYAATRLGQLYDMDIRKIRVIPLGIDFEKWRKALTHTITKTSSGKIIICVAKQYVRKGLADLLRAFALVARSYPKARLWLVGDGPERINNQNLSRALELEDRVTFWGDVTDFGALISLYAQAHVFCLPSYHETFGLAYLEAMTCALPVVAYDTTAVSEWLPPECSLLCRPGDVARLAENLLFLLTNERVRQNMGEAGLEKAFAMDWSRTAERILCTAEEAGLLE